MFVFQHGFQIIASPFCNATTTNIALVAAGLYPISLEHIQADACQRTYRFGDITMSLIAPTAPVAYLEAGNAPVERMERRHRHKNVSRIQIGMNLEILAREKTGVGFQFSVVVFFVLLW